MRKLFVFVAALGVISAPSPPSCSAAAFLRSFDGPELTWQPLDERAGARVVAHGCVGDDARQGSGSERLAITAPGGESLHFLCAVGRIPVLDEFEARLWVKANRPGVTLAARVVLPRSVDASTGAPRTALVQGDQAALASRWQQLRLAGLPSLLAAQARVLRAARGGKIDTHEAYVDAIVLELPGGPGSTVAWTDELEVDGVVLQAVAQSAQPERASPAVFSAPAILGNTGPGSPSPSTSSSSPSSPPFGFQGTTLLIGDRPFLMRGIEWRHESFAFLAAHGFNTVWLSEPPTPQQSAEASRAGVWLICRPPPLDVLANQGVGPALDRVLAWQMGTPAGPRDLELMRRWTEMLRSRDPQPGRPIVLTPRGDWLPASRIADVLVADHPASSKLRPDDFAEWLQDLPPLARPGTPFWVRVPTQPGKQAHDQLAALASAAAAIPSALDAERIEALVEAAAVNGCRGFLLQSASPLDASDAATQSRAVLVEQINNRLEAISPWLTIGKRIGEAASTDATATAIVLEAERARLLLPESWSSQPSQRTTPSDRVAFIVPGIPESNEAYLLTPAALEPLDSKRVAGGVSVLLERAAEGAVVMTEDPTVITGLRQHLVQSGSQAAQLRINAATLRSRSASLLAARFQRLGASTKGLDQALGSAAADIRRANTSLAGRDFGAAYQQAAAADRTLSAALERTRDELARGPALNSTPFGADAESAVLAAEFETSIKSLRSSENLLSGGDFEDLPQLKQLGWQHVEDPIPGIRSQVRLTGQSPQEGRYSLEISAAAEPPTTAPQIVARPLVWIASPPVRVTARDVIEITGWVRVPQPIEGNIDALEIIDSLGGQELALRVRQTDDWQPFRMIRSARDTTNLKLTFALCGVGAANIDGVMIRSLSSVDPQRLPPVANRSPPVLPNSARRSLFPPPADR